MGATRIDLIFRSLFYATDELLLIKARENFIVGNPYKIFAI